MESLSAGKRRFFLFPQPLFPDTPGVSLTHWLVLTGMLVCAGASLSVQFSGKGLRVFANGRQIAVTDQLAHVRTSLLLALKRCAHSLAANISNRVRLSIRGPLWFTVEHSFDSESHLIYRHFSTV